MEGIHYGRVPSGRRLEDLSPNELRLMLFNAGVDYSMCRTKKDLISLEISALYLMPVWGYGFSV